MNKPGVFGVVILLKAVAIWIHPPEERKQGRLEDVDIEGGFHNTSEDDHLGGPPLADPCPDVNLVGVFPAGNLGWWVAVYDLTRGITNHLKHTKHKKIHQTTEIRMQIIDHVMI